MNTINEIEIKFCNDKPVRIDKFLINCGCDALYSRSQIEKLIAERQITVNDSDIKKSYLLADGDLIRIVIPAAKQTDLQPEDIPLSVLFEDDYFAVIDKPAGLVCHPAPGHVSRTLVNAALYHFKDNLSEGNLPSRPGIVHRLDKDTSGLMIIAKTDQTHKLLTDLFARKEIKKTYLAILCGVPDPPHGTIQQQINRSKSDRKKMTVSDSGRDAVTHYEVLSDFHFYSKVQITLETGRTHQIRVHFAHINCPVLGDRTYNSLKRSLNMIPDNYHKKVKSLLSNHLQRQALHAFRLEFCHPVTSDLLRFEAPLPADMIYTLEWLENNFVI